MFGTFEVTPDAPPAGGAPAAAAGTGGTPVATDPYSVTATDNKFGQSTLRAQPNADVTFKFTNKGAALHSLTFLDKKGGTAFKEGAIIGGGKSEEVSFKAPAAGKYYFQCDVHPDQMFGTFEVTVDAPPFGAAPAAGATPAGSATATAAAR